MNRTRSFKPCSDSYDPSRSTKFVGASSASIDYVEHPLPCPAVRAPKGTWVEVACCDAPLQHKHSHAATRLLSRAQHLH